MPRRSEAFNRLRTYLRNNKMTYATNGLWLAVQDFTIQDSQEKEAFIVRCKPLIQHYYVIPWCEPDKLLSKAFSFQNTIKRIALMQDLKLTA
jgi:hypothetical protein